MSSSDIREWAGRGIEFGAHGRTHTDLTKLTGADLRQEIEGSAQELGNILDRRVASFAYPYGRVNEEGGRMVRNHFEMAFTTRWGINHPETDLYALRRTPVRSQDSLGALSCRLLLGWHPREQLLRHAFRMAHRLGFSRR